MVRGEHTADFEIAVESVNQGHRFRDHSTSKRVRTRRAHLLLRDRVHVPVAPPRLW